MDVEVDVDVMHADGIPFCRAGSARLVPSAILGWALVGEHLGALVGQTCRGAMLAAVWHDPSLGPGY